MSQTDRSQVQHKEVAEAQVARLEAFYAQLADVEAKVLEQARTAIEESARLSRETLAYQASVAAEWRKASLEAARRAAQMMTSVPANPFAPFFGGASS